MAPLRPACYSPTLTEPGNEFYATQSGVLARADQAELEYIGLELFEGLSTSPSGERLSTMQFSWHWDDNPDAPVKFRVFAQQLPIVIGSEGSYTLSLCEDPEAADDAAAAFPLQIFRNPMAPPAEDARFETLPG